MNNEFKLIEKSCDDCGCVKLIFYRLVSNDGNIIAQYCVDCGLKKVK